MNKELMVFANGVQVRTDKDGNICLNDLHQASGSDANKTPYRWQETESAKAFIDASCQILNNAKNDIIKTKRGKGGGTYAHKQIALAYAKYLSPDLHYAVNQVFFERLEEEKNPEISANRAYDNWKKQGKSDAWISARMGGIPTRKQLTSTLKLAGVNTPNGYRECTNAIYAPMYGGGAEVIRQKKGLAKTAKTREHMGELELIGIRMAEVAASENIKRKGLRGHKACEYECYESSKTIAQAITKIKNSK